METAGWHQFGCTTIVRPPRLQAHAWTALGKLCLVDEKLAKACVPHFARQLREAALPAVRNNIAVGLTDMCIAYTGVLCALAAGMAKEVDQNCLSRSLRRYRHCTHAYAHACKFNNDLVCAGLVDAHVPRLAACLSDEHELVRCQALALLAHLLQKVRHILLGRSNKQPGMLWSHMTGWQMVFLAAPLL